MKRPVTHRVLKSPIHWRSRQHAIKLKSKANDEGTVSAIRKYLNQKANEKLENIARR